MLGVLSLQLKSEPSETRSVVLHRPNGSLYLLPGTCMDLLDSVVKNKEKLFEMNLSKEYLSTDTHLFSPCFQSFYSEFYFYRSETRMYHYLFLKYYTIDWVDETKLKLNDLSGGANLMLTLTKDVNDTLLKMLPESDTYMNNEYTKNVWDGIIIEPALDDLRKFDSLLLQKDTNILVLTQGEIVEYIDVVKSILKENLQDSTYMPSWGERYIRIYYPVDAKFDKEKRTYYPHKGCFTNDMKYFFYEDKYYVNTKQINIFKKFR